MALTEQTKANRLNALKSTGPRTAEGKARSSRNALTHGLTAQEVVIPGEDPAAYQASRQQLIDDLQPNGSCEVDLVERLAATFWRLRRIPRFEAILMAWFENDALYQDAYSQENENLYTHDRAASHARERADKQTAARWSVRNPDEVNVWGRVLRDALTRDGMLLKLNSYEGRLLRQSQQLLGQFFALRKARAADFPLEAKPLNADDEIEGTSEVPSPSEVVEKETGETRRH
jgi:hypothetical protein